MKVKLVCKTLNVKKEIEVEDLFDSINYAKEIVKEAVNQEVQNPKVRIYTEYDDVAWAIITKKDIVEKIYQEATLTEYELDTLKEIVKSYAESGIENTDYYNTFGYNDRKRRGALSSLIKKQVVDCNICPDCFNPIYPIHNFLSTCKKYNIEVPSEVYDYCK